MLNEFFEQSTIDRFARAMKVVGPVIGVVLVYYFGSMAIDQFRGDAAALNSAVADDPAMPLVEAVARATAMSIEATDAAIAAVMVAAQETPTPESAAAGEATSPEAPANILAIFNKNTCGSCHVIPGIPNAVGVIGPDLSNIGVDGATRKEGMAAVDYIHESIVNPEVFLAPTCPTGPCLTGLMLPTFAQAWSEDELNQAVAYLASLQAE